MIRINHVGRSRRTKKAQKIIELGCGDKLCDLSNWRSCEKLKDLPKSIFTPMGTTWTRIRKKVVVFPLLIKFKFEVKDLNSFEQKMGYQLEDMGLCGSVLNYFGSSRYSSWRGKSKNGLVLSNVLLFKKKMASRSEPRTYYIWLTHPRSRIY